MLLFYLAVSKNVVKQKVLDFVDKNQVILKKTKLMCLTFRFAIEKCEVQLQGYDRWMKPLFVTFVFLQLLLFCSYSFSFIKYYLVFIISQTLLLFLCQFFQC